MHVGGAHAQLHGLLAQECAVDIGAYGGARLHVRHRLDTHAEALALVRHVGRGHLVDQHLGPTPHVERQHVDDHASGAQQSSLGDDIADCLLAIREQHDSLAVAVGQQRACQAQRGAEIRAVGGDARLESIEALSSAQDALDHWLAAGGNDGVRVVGVLGRDGLADVARLVGLGRARAGGQVSHEHHRLPIERSAEGQSGEGQDQQREDRNA